jgi:predicted membrane-bound spermidine synthase
VIRDPFRLPLAFFASGAAALLFEVLWFRALGRVLGNTVWAAALVLTAFMLGIALGGLLAARWSQRIRHPARAFAAAEAIVAVGGSLLVWGLPVLEAPIGRWLSPLADQPALTASVRLALALAAMLVPTIAMGMTLPMGVRVLAQKETTRALGMLYAANTFGACLAPMIAEYYLIDALGLRGTALAAAALNFVAAGLAFRLPSPAPLAAAASARSDPRDVALLLAAGGAGALALALEVVWFRLLLLYAPATDATFALLLLLMLAGIALGALLAPALARPGFAWVAAASSFAVVLGYLLTSPGQGSRLSDVLVYAIVLMMPAAVLSGSLFTLLGAQLRGGRENPQPAIGRLTFANTLGAAIGAALGGFVLLPGLGIERSLFLLAAGYVLLPLLFLERGAWRRALPAAVAVSALLLFPFGRMERHLHNAAATYTALDGSTVAHVIQGPTTTLQVLRADRFGEPASWRLLTDSHSMSAVSRDALRYMQFFAWLPLALHPEPRRALLISYGAGNTARALLDDPGVQELTMVDVSPEILAASRLIHGASNPLDDPRVRLVVEDGRHFLRTRRERFDIITAEPPPPMMAGVVNLYSREYFMALAERLAPGGLATYWLPVKQFQPRGARAVIAAFCDAFPDCTLWSGVKYEWILMGGRDFRHRPAMKSFARLWDRAESAARIEASGFEHPAQIGAAFLADAEHLRRWLDGAAPVTDDHPKRMATDPPSGQPPDEYPGLLNPQAAAANFRSSRWIAAHWPREVFDDVLQFYAVQPILNGEMPVDPALRLELIDALLRRTQLAIPVLWMLDSDMTEQQIIDRRLAAAGGKQDPAYAYPLGVRWLARGDYVRAAALLAQAAEQDPKLAGAIAAYAACRAGLGIKARAVKGADLLPSGLRCWK